MFALVCLKALRVLGKLECCFFIKLNCFTHNSNGGDVLSFFTTKYVFQKAHKSTAF